MRDWITTTIGEFIDFNPSEKLQKNKIAKKIPMDKLGTFERKLRIKSKTTKNNVISSYKED